MKKEYINPETSIVLLTLQTMIANSIPEFDGQINEDEEPIDPKEMLSRRHNNVWDEESEEEEKAKNGN